MSPASFLRLTPLLALAALGSAAAQVPLAPTDPNQLRRAIANAQSAGAAAGRRAAELEAQATTANAAVEKTAREAAGLAARIQQAEAGIAVNEARAALIERERVLLRARLAERQQPLVQLTAALQRLARRPAAFALLRPGSVQDTVYLRAALEAMLPEVERRTADLRAELDRSRALQAQARANAAGLRQAQRDLAARRQALAALESRQRLEARAAGGLAAREAERALALAEQARDLNGLVGQLDEASRRRAALAALPGPILRPAVPGAAVVAAEVLATASASARIPGFVLPLAGQVVSGFGTERPGQPRSRGVTLLARPAAQIVAPAAGRVVFAGAYRGYGQIVIIEHPGGWTSLVTGLSTLDVEVGDRLVGGSPLGITGPGQPLVTLELRKDGQPVNPLDQLGR
ncbi:murein hydrolase activator EnvC family protein [Novosphingobium ginsenosidimutans]|uniref:Peptidoglycan DD-metalloendopeptidase family protein n=1 Tax=Novosphingobium ginsenosidimutans TaxID=1176536 RepID=A0A5B8S2P4_9SPHN|nr:peptidoglycan DD-metalloendopeptidase family protein [Novosphingobium ginsenosidimutans]QEA15796.1 peptidoglycan DD-metalloendopeptidase family protein [Novosphingobium ginsenosidimutans]